jgi:hypothetical protein
MKIVDFLMLTMIPKTNLKNWNWQFLNFGKFKRTRTHDYLKNQITEQHHSSIIKTPKTYTICPKKQTTFLHK